MNTTTNTNTNTNQLMIRMQYSIFPTHDAATNAGYPDAEFGNWQASPASTKLTEGWIALAYDTES